MGESATPPAATLTVPGNPEENSDSPSPPEFKTLCTQGIPEEYILLIAEQLQKQKDANWGDLLSAAPRTLCSLGQCFVIAWSEGAEKMVQTKDATISKYLRANLVDCSDLGRAAFREAEGKLNVVSLAIRNITEYDGVIDGILNCLNKGNPTASELTAQLEELQRLADDCEKKTASVIDGFKEWRKLAQKINDAYAAPADGMISSMIRWLLSLNMRFGAKKAVPVHEQEGAIPKESDFLKNEDKSTKNPSKSISGFSLIWNRWVPRLVRDLLDKRKSKAQSHGFSRTPTVTTTTRTDKHNEEKAKHDAYDRLAKQQKHAEKNFDDIEHRFRAMSPGEKAVNDMRKVLRDCQNNLEELIEDTDRLHGFFRMLHTLVGIFLKYHESAKSMSGSVEPGESKEWISNLRADVWKLCVHYTIAEDISHTYVTVSRKYIMPGVNKVDSLSRTRTDRDTIDDVIKTIADYSKKAQDEILGLAEQRREILKERLVSEGRVEEEIDKVGRRGTLLE